MTLARAHLLLYRRRRKTSPPRSEKIADDLYFFFEFDGSTPSFSSPRGVLLIDTRTHPRNGKDLLDRIRK